ncbi:DUF5304 family protein [Streptacidiphilus carbonis]|jgi:hypothetical protein|uniref:DUF5304 family protein n=1 Tax=Streptacidiphilus carbonis TaxID=105422 RepID=UPI000693A425|nr:DUF5304 family protein [Streptacidiphilus carbonis]
MTTADDRNNEDVWAEAVAEAAEEPGAAGPAGAAAPAGTAGDGDTPVPDATSHDAVAEKTGSGVADQKPSAPGDLFGPELTPLVDEVRRFATDLGERVSAASTAASNGDSLGALQNLAAPLRAKHPEVYGHLIAAGGELLAAYRAAVSASEKRWTAEKPASSEQIDLD